GARAEQRVALAKVPEDAEARVAERGLVATELGQERIEARAAGQHRVLLDALEKERGQRIDLEEVERIGAVAGQEDQRRYRRRLGGTEVRRDAMHRKAISEHARKRRGERNAVYDVAVRIAFDLRKVGLVERERELGPFVVR